MTGNDILQRALILMGYTDQNGEPDAEITRRAARHGLAAVTQIYKELSYASGKVPQPILLMSEPLPLAPRLLDEVMPYGVAMLLAVAEGDAGTEAAFALIYNRKRCLLTTTEQIIDSLP
ncbi:MAG: hypothetical protein IIX68_07405 [Clostridia bacterium]|nr:hypothetical protein [Clostridia bacterium]